MSAQYTDIFAHALSIRTEAYSSLVYLEYLLFSTLNWIIIKLYTHIEKSIQYIPFTQWVIFSLPLQLAMQ